MSEENGLLSQAPGSEPPLRGELPVTRHRGRGAHVVGGGRGDRRVHGEGRVPGDGRTRDGDRVNVESGGHAGADANADIDVHIGGGGQVGGGGQLGDSRDADGCGGRADAGGHARGGDPGAFRRLGRAGGRSAGAGVRLAVRAAHAAERAEVTTDIHRFADRSLRAVLEVLDRRRQVEQLAGIADPLVLAAVRTLVSTGPAPERALGTAVLARVDVRLVAADTAELCAGYHRGDRRFALAARAVRRRASGWRLTALRVR